MKLKQRLINKFENMNALRNTYILFSLSSKYFKVSQLTCCVCILPFRSDRGFWSERLCALHGTKCPLLTAFVSLLSFFLSFFHSPPWVTFLPERVVQGFLNFAGGFNSQKN